MAANQKKGRISNVKPSASEGTQRMWVQKNNSEQVKKIELLRELDQLEKQVTALEREKQTHLYSRRSEFRQEYHALEDQESWTVGDRKAEKAKLQGQLERMRNSVDKFQHQLQNVKPTPEFVEKLKESMEDIESIVNAFKDQQRKIYEDLMKEEKLLWQEIMATEKRFESWAQAPPIVIPQPKPVAKVYPVSSTRNAVTAMPPEIAAFEMFLKQTGGHRGGWDEYDHGTFMKIRNKYKGRRAFMDEAAVCLPGRDITDVTAHESWYQEYSALLQRKKDAIQKWRLVKEAKKDEIMSNVGEDDEDEVGNQKALEMAQRVEEERMERMSKLNAWKVQKELERVQEEERQMEEEYRKAKKEEIERQRKMETKARVHVQIQQRRERELLRQMEEEARREAEAEERRRAAAQDRIRFLERDRRQLEGRLARERAKEEEGRRRKERLERLKGQVEVQAKRDPTRLYQLTAGLKERQKDTTSTSGGRVLHIPHRAIPSWRAGPS